MQLNLLVNAIKQLAEVPIVQNGVDNQPLEQNEQVTYKIENTSVSQSNNVYENILFKYDSAKTTRYYRFVFTKIKDNQIINSYEMERRYSHFEWLQTSLQIEFLGIVIPSLPDKSIYDIDLDRRKSGLEYFLEKIIDHPRLFGSRYTQKFLLEVNSKIFEAFVGANPVSSGIIYDIADKTKNFIGSFMNVFTGNGGFVLPVRVCQQEDFEFDQVEKDLKSEAENVKIIGNTVEKIVNNMQIKLDALEQAQKFFKPDCSQEPGDQILNSIYNQYKRCLYRIRDNILFKIESNIRDFDAAIDVIKSRKAKKDEIHEYSKKLQHNNFRDQHSVLKVAMQKTEEDVVTLDANFKEDFQTVFCQKTKERINILMTLFDQEIVDFYSNVAQIESIGEKERQEYEQNVDQLV